MIWKKREINMYPNIILSDSTITGIQTKDSDVTCYFSEYGFFKRDDEQNKYYRTDGAQIVIEQCDIENAVIKEVRTQQLSENLYFDSMYDVELSIFQENINTGKWSYEIVEEYYSAGGGIYLGQIRENDYSFWCYVKLRFKNLAYFWNDIRYDWPY